MNDSFLSAQLDRVDRRHRWLVFWRMLAVCWAGSALLAAGLVGANRWLGWNVRGGIVVLALAATLGVAATVVWLYQRRPNYPWLARRIEATFPDLDGVLLTAVEQPIARDAAPDFLQYRVIHEAIKRSQEQDWRRMVPPKRFVAVHAVHAVALVCLVIAVSRLAQLHSRTSDRPRSVVVTADGVTVTPGDTEIERGESFVVLARFARAVPSAVTLELHENGSEPKTMPLSKSMADPVFGGTVANVAQSFTYRLDYGGQKTRDFKVNVYEHPRLVRADADLTFPTYTKVAPRHIDDTRRVSAVEGTRIDLALQLNKPVRAAKLIARDAAKTVITATVTGDQPAAKIAAWTPEHSGTYDLQLIDADGRANKVTASFVIDVQPNRPPELKLTTPHGDLRPSALEEITFQGTVWDDFGTTAYGLGYSIAGGATKSIELGRDVPAKEKRGFTHLLSLEALGAKTDDLVSWYVWSEDIGPDGKPRRTNGDLYFAEVRPFDEVFRESQDMQSSDDESPGGGGGNATRRLTELQKQIIGATWKLQRGGATATYSADVTVVRDSQQQALEQARQAAEEVRSPRAQGLWQSAIHDMTDAIDRLKAAAKEPAPLAQALPPEQNAYQTLLKLRARDTAVTRGQRGRSGGGRGQAANQRQIDQLDLRQAENRYETQRQARAQQDPQRSEQLATMNRLQDLARRQQDLNERLKELQTALQEAQTDRQREELRQQLKRLEDEQRQMLADADELRQRMDRAENQSTLSPQRQELDQARDDLRRAADAVGQGSVSQALSAGTRAQRQLQQTRDELRQQSSGQFADELRDMRSEARDLSRRQEQLQLQLAQPPEGAAPRKSLGESGEHPELANELAQQRERWNRLLERARQTSEQAENSEPLVSKQLYDSVRKATQDDAASVSQLQQDLVGSGQLTLEMNDRLERLAQSSENGKALDLARDLTRAGDLESAGRITRRAGDQIDELRRGVERAAESVIGDDVEELKLARSELDRLTDQLRDEARTADTGEGARAGGQNTNEPRRPGDIAQNADDERSNNGSSPATNSENGMNDANAAGQGSSSRHQRGERSPTSDREESRQLAQSGDGEQPAAGGQGRGSAGRRGRISVDTLLNQGAEPGVADESGGDGGGRLMGDGPLTGRGFAPWTDRLREVEQLLDSPELRDAVAAARERARLLRRDIAQSKQKPDWTVVQLQVVKPLLEVRDRVAEELARRDHQESLAPVDHDPVPNRFAESVRRYYEELGKDSPAEPRKTPSVKLPEPRTLQP